MKHKLLFYISIIFFESVSFAQLSEFSWAICNDGHAYDESFTIDKNGNSYIIGNFPGTIDFDPGPSKFELSSHPFNWSSFVQKIDENGNFVWAISIGEESDELRFFDVKTDSQGNVFVKGAFDGKIDFDPSDNYFYLTSTNWNVFILKLDKNGNFMKVVPFLGTSYIGSDKSFEIDDFDNLYILNSFGTSIDVDPGINVYPFNPENGHNCLIKLDSQLNFIWVQSIIGNVHDITLDSNQNSYIIGEINLSGTYYNSSVINVQGLNDICIQKIDFNGNPLWAKSFGSILDDNGNAITCDSNGDIYSTGYFSSSVDFDPGIGTYNLNSKGYIDYYIQKLDGLGNFIWAYSFGGIYGDFAYDVVTNSLNEVLITGAFSGSVDFNPTVEENEFDGSNDIFIQHLDSNGDFIATNVYSDSGWGKGQKIEIDSQNNIYFLSEYGGQIELHEENEILILPGYSNYFLQRFGTEVNNSVFSSDYDIKIGPNPTTGNLYVIQHNLSSTAIQKSTIEIKIYDYYGKLLEMISSNNIYTVLDISTFNSGVYFVNVNYDDKLFNFKVLKMNQ